VFVRSSYRFTNELWKNILDEEINMSEENTGCAAVNCKNTSAGTHRFPKEPER
jgi:hypothetical protein